MVRFMIEIHALFVKPTKKLLKDMDELLAFEIKLSKVVG